jgi:pimeloyl-ACP methyl ester carboxylesterase
MSPKQPHASVRPAAAAADGRLVSSHPGIDAVLERHRIAEVAAITWPLYEAMAAAVQQTIAPQVTMHRWDYVHPESLQVGTPERLRKPRAICAACTVWGEWRPTAVVCLGGIANTARRFDVLARHLGASRLVICPDWMGRGASGWLPEQADYGAPTCIEQVMQLIDRLGLERVVFVGSSLGGNVAMRIAAAFPDRVAGLVLNDVGAFIPAARRSRRAQSVGRHYVFRTPASLFQRGGAAQKHDGPVDDAILLHNAHHQARWASNEDGRIYRHDPRALAAWRAVAAHDHDQWDDWCRVRCPVLLIHGLLSDALLPETIRAMAALRPLDVIRVPATGHTPTLADPPLVEMIGNWIEGGAVGGFDVTCTVNRTPSRVLFAPPAAHG